jgi:hypothetical protein
MNQSEVKFNAKKKLSTRINRMNKIKFCKILLILSKTPVVF